MDTGPGHILYNVLFLWLFLFSGIAPEISEYYIPYAVNTFIANGYAKMHVLKTTAQWFGVTYKEDRPSVVARLQGLHDQGVY